MIETSRACAAPIPLQPCGRDPKRWWETFWRTEPSRFGDPSDTLLNLVPQPAGGAARAVDIGSGNGRYAVELARIGFYTDAVEWTDSGVEEIRRRARAARTEVHCINACFLRIAREKRCYDLVFSSGLLEEIPQSEQEAALRGYASWVRPGGTLLIRYCTEISGRGNSIDARLAMELLQSTGMEIYHLTEDQHLKLGRSGMWLRAATIAARQRKREVR